MPAVKPKNVKDDITAIAAKYGIEVVGFLKLDDHSRIPAGEMSLLNGVKWEDGEVDLSNVHDPLEIMPSAKTMVILGKKLLDDRSDIYYKASDGYSASVEMMLLEIAASKIIDALRKNGAEAGEYTSYYLKVWAVLCGLGWIGKSRMFVSKAYGPRLRLRGVLTSAEIGETHAVLPDESCGECTECIRACPVGAISATEVDRKKCGACPVNHRKLTENARAYCTACTTSCPVGKPAGHKHAGQAISRQ
ncbi:MAG TPA: epoxyqueuosine reductase [Methanocella sp.]|uniref:epoxyqueuosine reductase n=1 Tax=Methanocella sp. TaxID=2052833 RepID=UPI002BB43195|nr:epoxyqueuosine reductase [Methanocella sp.]HTY90412.1 epoxyqueuosine reductase [Methanocella sp.]